MKAVSIAALKAKLSGFLRLVKAGGTILITEHGVPVARIVPLDAGDRRNGRRDRLAAKGVIDPGRGRVRASLLTPPRGPMVGRGVLEALIRERAEGR